MIILSSPDASAQDSVVLDDFDDVSPWRVIASTQVSGTIRALHEGDVRALCLDYDFNGVSGYVGVQRDLERRYPENYRFDFRLRGQSPDNDLQFKLVDASGDNVWWANRPKYVYPTQWMPVRYKRRHIGKAWGPGADPILRHSAKLEFTVSNYRGGKGTVCFDELRFTALPTDAAEPRIVSVAASKAARQALAAADGDAGTRWRARVRWRASERQSETARLVLDLGRSTEFGGLRLDWGQGEHATHYDVLASEDGNDWRMLRSVEAADGGRDWIALPEAEGRYVAIAMRAGPKRHVAISEVSVEPLAFAATPNDFVAAVAKDQPRGRFPRGFSGEQAYWTILGRDGGTEQGLIGEDGAIETAKGGFSIEPLVIVDGKLLSWADVGTTQSLQDGYLPIPSVDWQHANAALRITAFAEGAPQRSQLIARYQLRNPDAVARDYALALVAQPFQVNPPSQFLNTTGGVSRVESLAVEGGVIEVNGEQRVFVHAKPDAAFASVFDGGMATAHLDRGEWPDSMRVSDSTGLASGAMLYRFRLAPGESREVSLSVPLTGEALCTNDCDVRQRQDLVAQSWRRTLDRVRLKLPESGKPLMDTLRTSLAHQLISRIGPRLQPGTRSYARSWIRDGAMIAEGLLRMGREDTVREYLDWYAPYQFDNGKVPCCVDDRGSDPVPENDSHGELIFAIAEYARFTGDRDFLQRMWPHVAGAFGYMETLRASERTEANRALDPAFYGMMPVSISHEGYSAKPMHSYWDNFWALRGYKDAVWVAQQLGRGDDAVRMARARDEFRADLHASLLAAARRHGIDYLPGAAELGDFDPTSTTIALAPGGEQSHLPQALLHGGFERYWREFVQRRDGQREWKDYTPYEWRNVGAFVRLGWRERASEAVRFFFDDRAPRGWNQWGEVVSRTPRKPFFLGDLPHAWVASDFMRSALDMFAYLRESDDGMVLAAGVPADWLTGDGIEIDGLRTQYGELAYALRSDGKRLSLTLRETTRLPPGGAILPWPFADARPGRTFIDGAPAMWRNAELRIPETAVSVEIEILR
ncbi:MAG: coagulation factor 5/8 type domain-containing protein [Lysobacteraceae bacterium]|nr:MAG: coagulation factor 5/8 type domain-containing protein [Xanthomonadaceae bacterium]